MAIPLLPLLSAAPGIISGVANLFGSKRRRKEEEKASRETSGLADVFKQNLQGDYFDTAEAQGAMTGIQQNQEAQQGQINASAATNGLTDEARIAMMGRNNQAAQEATGGIARSADLWRQRGQQQYGQQLNSLFSVGQSNRRNFNQSLSNVLGPLSQGIDTAANVGAFDGMSIGKGWGKGKG